MTKVVLSSDFTVRVWITEKSFEDEGPRSAVYDALLPFRTGGLSLRGQGVAGLSNWGSTAKEIALALERVPDVAAYEILDAAGNGIVVYTDWP